MQNALVENSLLYTYVSRKRWFVIRRYILVYYIKQQMYPLR